MPALIPMLSGLWGKALPYIIGAATIVVGLVLLVGKLVGLGRSQEKAARAEADRVVRDRVDAVQPPAAGETESRLDQGRF